MMHEMKNELMHHSDPSGVYQPQRIGMMHAWSTCESLTRAEFMHHEDKGDNVLKHHMVLKGLNLKQRRRMSMLHKILDYT